LNITGGLSMSEEQAFLDAIAASPFDDTPRLVYADWLDEHDQPAKAEYLRLVVSLVPILAGEDPDPAATERLLENATLLPLDWRMAAAARFMVVLYGYEADQKIQTIKVVRELTGQGLAEAKQFVEELPARFPLRTTPEGAIGIRSRLLHDAKCKVGVHPSGGFELSRVATYSVGAELIDYEYLEGYDNSTEDPPMISGEAIDAFRAFVVSALGISREPYQRDEVFVQLASGLEPAELEKRMADLRALLPPNNPDRRWDIVLHSYYQLPPSPSR
jgi:uncharacterized protein (TIGR02996 family)